MEFTMHIPAEIQNRTVQEIIISRNQGFHDRPKFDRFIIKSII